MTSSSLSRVCSRTPYRGSTRALCPRTLASCSGVLRSTPPGRSMSLRRWTSGATPTSCSYSEQKNSPGRADSRGVFFSGLRPLSKCEAPRSRVSSRCCSSERKWSLRASTSYSRHESSTPSLVGMLRVVLAPDLVHALPRRRCGMNPQALSSRQSCNAETPGSPNESPRVEARGDEAKFPNFRGFLGSEHWARGDEARVKRRARPTSTAFSRARGRGREGPRPSGVA